VPRVLQILNRLIIGGPAVIAVSLTERLRTAGWETGLVIGGKDDHEQDAAHLIEGTGVEPITIPHMRRDIRPQDDRAAYKEVKKIIQDFKPDVVHTHAAKSGAIGRLAASAARVPVIVHTFHGHVFHSYFGRAKTRFFLGAERYLARKSSGIIAISEAQKIELADTYRIAPADRIRVVPLGLNLEPFARAGADATIRQTFRTRYGIAHDEVAIGIIGRIVPVKNHALFTEVVGRLQAMGGHHKIRWIIVGDGDQRTTMESGLRAHGVDYTYWPDEQRRANAICTSWLTDISEVMSGLDMIVLTSHNEGTPVSLIEAQAAGRPVVSTDVGGVKDAVVDGQTGFLTPPGDPATMADALLKLVVDPTLRQTFGAAGQTFAQEHFSLQRLVRDTDAYYRELLHNKSVR
jgi:glycosyltransferase involved in cell wall biosynthesis